MTTKYKSLVKALYSQPWAATEEAIENLQSILDERRAGVTLTHEEIRLRIDAAGGTKKQQLMARMGIPYDAEEESPYLVQGSTAIISLAGTLFAKANMLTQVSGCTSYQEFKSNIVDAMNRSDVARIVIDCDSPGGQAVGCKDAADLLYSLRGGSKPITAYVSGQCCSAAMYIAAAAGRIVSSPSALLGSIGTLMVIHDTSAAYAEAGVKVNVLRSSPLKAAGTDGEKFDGKLRASLESVVQSLGAQFEEDIAKYRGVSADTVRERFGQGGVLTPKAALAVGMIDAIATWEEFFTPLAQQTSAPTSGRVQGDRTMKYGPQVQAVLFGGGLISGMDASDEVVAGVVAGLFGAPKEKVTAEEVLGKMHAKTLPAVTPSQIESALSSAAPLKLPPDEQTIAQRTQAAERLRYADLSSQRSILMRNGAEISDAEFQQAVDSGISAADATLAWTKKLQARETMVNNPGVSASGSEYDNWMQICVEAMAQRSGGPEASHPQAKIWANRRTADIAREDLKRKGLSASGSDGEVIANWTRSCAGPGGVVNLEPGTPTMSGGAYTGAASFPNALGGVLNIVFMGTMKTNKITFPQWSRRLPDAPDFRPSTIFSLGGEDEFDLNMTAKEPMQADIAEESTQIFNDRYDKQFIWTPVMQANDNGALAQGVQNLRMGHDFTLERLHYNLLVGGTSNLGPDGQIVFTSGTLAAQTPAARGNAITSGGGGPTDAQLTSMGQYASNQVWNKLNEDGTTYKRLYTGDVSKVLVSHYWRYEAIRNLTPFGQLPETKAPVTDATVNIFRGSIQPIYMPLLNEQADPKYWYAIYDAADFIVHVFQTGYGMGGKQTVVVNMVTGAVQVVWEGRFGATYVRPQQCILNYGS